MSTEQKFLPTCDPNLTPIAASRLYPFTSRRAIDSSGRLGSFYDACNEQVLHNYNFNFAIQSAQSRRLAQCYIKTCKAAESSNLLEWYNMDDELRLSVVLKMVGELGVGELINYSRPINEYTRFIEYKYYHRTEYLPCDEYKRLYRKKIAAIDIPATHVIVLVNWGIDAVAVVQLPPDNELIREIDHVLLKLSTSLNSERTDVILSEKDRFWLEQIGQIEVFSNTPELRKISSVIDFHRVIPQVKNNTKFIKPYNYNLSPVQYFYNVNNKPQSIFKELQEELSIRIEHYLLELSRNFNRLRAVMIQDHPNIQQYFNKQFSEMSKKWSYLEEMYLGEIQRLHQLVIGVRRGEIEQKLVPDILNNTRKEKLMKDIDDFAYELTVMDEKEHLIVDLIKKHFEYRNAADYDIKHGDDQQTIMHKLCVEDVPSCVICFNELLVKNKTKWDELNTHFISKQKEDHQLRFIYVDFSYSSCQLTDFLILPILKKDNNTPPVSKSIPSSEPPLIDDTINILLLGESGVGKSTFINAFVNYLLFDELNEAKNKSVVLIPVSFPMTTGDDFQERTVTFGGMDTMNNEDHDSPGQSVTQHCRSYLFTLKGDESKGRKLRIIDTPGIGDVRGLAQDDINMQHILTYINNLTHLNAVCILMKPNYARLNILFRTCFMQLFDLLGENVSEKIIFCFTNSRSTFYTPGNTAPLLKTLLQSLPSKQVLFSKKNTFCFDSESFRYLVAIQNGINFNEFEEAEYQDSWQKSSNESKRFLEYIQGELTAPLSSNETKSMKYAQLDITMMIRPLLESMRNILRNIVFCKAGRSSISIELRPKSIRDSKAICLTYPSSLAQFGDFWVKADTLHLFHNKCRDCECSPQEHFPIDYELGYELCNSRASHDDTELTTMVDDLCQTSAEFAHFLTGTTDNTQNDLFLIGIERMIKEEEDICANKTSNQLNLNLRAYLIDLKKKYEEAKVKLLAEKKEIPLLDVYKKIEELLKYDMIKSQIFAAKEWHKFMIERYEYEVPV